MNEYGNPKPDLNWLLDDMVNRVVGAQNAIVLSADGLLIGKSAGMSKDDSDQLSAIASSLQSLAKGVSKQFNRGPVLQNMIEMERGYLFVSAAGQGACLAVLAADNVDVEMIAYEMSRLVKRVGDYMASAPREAASVLREAT
ncbi:MULTISPECIES: roadblock/LC7 domain-containing protein [Amycolatopsis]|jgi:predicted regulator of Ras-like GTPase activity (Roadblock/LC7/MglB family)|uniref:Predicted regulator of Ras-like GTPase activity, Roadblock/LC7/MglB family n=1 Tax=Amycolatopsis tolypomycina TaxID=208445 RepID=A0A1H4ZA23_9PSEU|nr:MULTISPECIES: roadblock/LC7 domain-containing protein [Amycolatopsis]MDQ7807846.1 roadblock/LC7 domain-containing protein [Amycolatopsis sp. A133]WIX93185.1 roadblock/LC7 domain-containing protein [Amycolatopsis sp. DG1A-15b]SED26261.1 Predicted regulator of Ras-like GTPase activity, Roadblock/LC7/MglB family [Amycolatopsis tolypomycina]HET6707414.1 roadblock/LC7 domain-containing protein [Amycolatopsis sp.]